MLLFTIQIAQKYEKAVSNALGVRIILILKCNLTIKWEKVRGCLVGMFKQQFLLFK